MKIEKDDLAGINPPAHATRFEKIGTAGGDVVLCNPTRQQLRRWRAEAMKVGGNIGDAFEALFVDTCIKPDTAGVKVLLDEWPGLTLDNNVVEAMQRLAGISNDEAGKS